MDKLQNRYQWQKLKKKRPLTTPSMREGFHHKKSGKAAEWCICRFGKIEKDERIL